MSTQRDDNADRAKRLVLNFGKSTAARIMSGAHAAKPNTLTVRRDATADGRRLAMSLGLVTEQMFAAKLDWPLTTFRAAMGKTIPQPDACQSPAAWTVGAANNFLEFMGRAGRFSPGSVTLARKVDSTMFARLLGKSPTELAAMCASGTRDELPPTVLFTDGTQAWDRETVYGHLLTLSK